MKVQKTHSMSAGAGFAIRLTDEAGNPVICRYVQVTAKGDCYVRAIYAEGAVMGPGASPAPAAGQSTDYMHLASSGDQCEFDWAKGASDSSGRDRYSHVVGWGIGAADLLIVGN